MGHFWVEINTLAAESDVITLVGEWPEDLDFPGEGIGNPAHDTLWCYDFKATPGYRVRVTGIDPESDLKGARVTAVPEGPEFWDYVLNGTYVPAPNQSSIPQLARPVVKNLRVSEKVNLQGDTEWYELSCVWDVEGECDHAQVWAGRDGSELRMVDGNAQGARSTFRIDGAGEWLIEVRPFNANGQSGQAAAKLFITAMTGLPPRNPGTFVVQEVAGGLRRFSWMWSGDKPAALSGVQIRYLPGDVPVSVASWDAMQPLGEADDIYTAQFETTKPGAGTWTFGLRAIDTAGQLANGVMRFVETLDEVFDNLREPDLTPPPAPAGMEASSALANIMLSWEQPAYNEGHGHQFTRVYAAEVTAAVPSPGLAQAEVAAEIVGPVGSVARALGTSWRLWFVNVSNDGVESVAAGPLDVTVGKIGNADLGELVVEAGNLANGAVSASKFASGIEPVSIVTGESLPTVKSTSNITFKGQLYTWSETAGKYELPEFNGSIGGANLVKNAALLSADAWGVYANGATVSPTLELLPGRYPNRKWAKVVAQSPCESLGLWQTPLPYVQVFRAHQEYTVSVRVKSANLAILQFTWNFWPTKLYRYNTAVAIGPDERVISLTFAYSQDAVAQLHVSGYHASIFPMPVGSEIWLTEPQLEEGDTSTAWAPNPIDLPPGSIHGVQIADDSITAPKLVAGSVVAGKLAANAVSAENLQVGAVVAGKLAADAVTAGAVAAGAITAEKLAVGAIAAGSAAIQNGAIGNAMIGDAAIDNAKIVNVSASKITAGYMQVGSYIASTNYAPGASGFVSYASGNAEYNNITMRGTVYANSGVIGGININANGLNAGGFSGYAWPASGGGFHLGPNGLLLGNSNTGQYVQMTSSGGLYAPGLTINGGNATFGGNLSAASGTFYGSGSFSGTLSASTLTTAGGRFTAYSDGSVVADRVDIRRREAMATGSVYWGASSTTSDPISLWGPDGALIYIDTGIDFAAATDFSVNQPLHAVAEVYSSMSQGGVINGTRLFEVMCSATPFISASHYPGVFDWPYTHATSQLSPRIYIAVRARIVNQQPSLWQVTLGSVRWSLFKS